MSEITCASAPETAALTTPRCGRPNHPRISAGVNAIESTVLTIKNHSGVFESPVPRKNVV